MMMMLLSEEEVEEEKKAEGLSSTQLKTSNVKWNKKG